MDRRTRVASLWNWLPGFRAVAETENVHAAARLSSVSPSALSRTIRLLEDHVGAPLFERNGRGLQLTATGRELLDVVRRAMRSVDDVLTVNAPLPQTLCIAIQSGLAESVVMDAVALLQARDRALKVTVAGDPEREPVQRLLVGELDVVVTFDPPCDERLSSSALRAISFGIYAHADHALARCAQALDGALAYPFISYPAPPNPPADRWPAMLARNVGMHVHDARLALGACRHGDWLAVFPDALVADTVDGQRSNLRRLDLDVIAPATMSVVYRKPTGHLSQGEVFLRALHECCVSNTETRRAEH